MTLIEVIDKYEEQINNEEFEPILKDNSIPFELKLELVYFLYDELLTMSKSLYSYFPNFDKEVNAMNNHLLVHYHSDPYYGERLWWLIEGDGKPDRAALYLHYYQRDSYYEVEKVDEKYAWYGSGDDYYICRKDRWDINKFYSSMDAVLAEEI